MSSGSIDAIYGGGPLNEQAHPKPRSMPAPVPPPLPPSKSPSKSPSTSQPRAKGPVPPPRPVPIPIPRPIPIPVPPQDKSVVDPTRKQPKAAEETEAPKTWRELLAGTLRRREFVTTTVSSVLHMVLIIVLALLTIEAKKKSAIMLTSSPDVERVRPDLIESQASEVPLVAAGPQVSAVTAPATVVHAPKNLGTVAAPKTVASLNEMILSDSAKTGGAGGLDAVSFFGSTTIAKRVIFVVDNSQSMETGNRWQRAKEEVLTAVSNLSPQQQFYVFFFSDRDYPMLGAKAPSGMVKLDVPMWDSFTAWLNRLELYGDTMAESALRKAYAMKPDVIYLMTDGEFFDNTVEFLMKMKYSKIRVNTIGFQTSDAGREALKKIAETLKGEYTEVD